MQSPQKQDPISEELFASQLRQAVSILLSSCELAVQRGAFSVEESSEIFKCKQFFLGGEVPPPEKLLDQANNINEHLQRKSNDILKNDSQDSPRMINSKEDFDSVISADKLTVVDFTAEWCGPCKSISPKFTELSKKYRDICFVKVDVDKNEEVTVSCNIQSMPTFQFYKNGKLLDTFSGANIEKLEKYIQELSK